MIDVQKVKNKFICWMLSRLMGKKAYILAIDNEDGWVTTSISGINGKLVSLASNLMYREETQRFFLQAAADHMTEMNDLMVEAQERLKAKPYKERVVN